MSIIINRIPSAVSGRDSLLLAFGPACLSCAGVLDRQLVGPAAGAHYSRTARTYFSVCGQLVVCR